jgi:prepilin-type N-terminal cleavage/methylation domain-containing protein
MKNRASNPDHRPSLLRRAGVTQGRGFTLVELMIAVVIIGVLASLTIYGVRNSILNSKTSEAGVVIGDVMARQEQFLLETHRYLNVTGDVTGDDDYYPEGGFDGRQMIQWGADGGCQGLAYDGTTAVSCVDGFRALGVNVSNPVRFRYAVTTFDAGGVPPVPSSHVTGFNVNNVTSPKDGYVVVALSDLDGDGDQRTAVVGSSMRANLYMENQGE